MADFIPTHGVSDTTDYVGRGRMEGKVVVVTGGSKAIGKTVVEVLALEGANVYFCGRDSVVGEETCKAIVDRGAKVFFTAVDVADTPSLKAWIEGVGEKEGKIDALIPNAAAFVFGGIEEVDDEAWDKVLSVNVRGYANTVKFALPFLKPSFIPYNASKGAIIQLCRCLAMDLGPFGIRVNAVAPGTIDTPATDLHAAKLKMTKEELTRDAVKSHFLKRLGTTLECAMATLFLASPESSFTTGSALMVDGGLTAH